MNINGFGVKFDSKTHEIYTETTIENIGKSKHNLVQAILCLQVKMKKKICPICRSIYVGIECKKCKFRENKNLNTYI